MPRLVIPVSLRSPVEAHQRWLHILREAEETVKTDTDFQVFTSHGYRLKERALPPEVLGRIYAQYCDLINKLYDAYLNSIQLQRAPYIHEIITLFVKRMYELRNEMVHLIVNDYIYVDAALLQLKKTPFDIQIVVPYHFPLESRSEDIEQLLQKMWADAYRRKKKSERPKKTKPPQYHRDSLAPAEPGPPVEDSDEDINTPPASVHTIIPGEYTQTCLIQRHERYRQWRMQHEREQAARYRLYFREEIEEAPIELKTKASTIIQKVYREYMKIKRERIRDIKRDVLLGLIPDPFRTPPNLLGINNKMFERRRNTRMKIQQTFLEEQEKEKTRLLLFKTGTQIDDITDEIRNWFKEWFYGYHFFPEFPYEIEGGTLLVVRGDFITVQEKLELDDKLAKESKGRSADQVKDEKKRMKAEAKIKEQARKDALKKEHIALMKARCNPLTDPGYAIHESALVQDVAEVLRNYRASWSLFDELPADKFGETVYGYMKPLITEDLMKEIHIDCRRIVDEMMRLDLKLLIQKHQMDYNSFGMKYPNIKPRKKPKPNRVPKTLILDEKLLRSAAIVFDLGIVSKPTTKLTDVHGDSNYAAYDYNIKDPDCRFPLPGYGDIKERLKLSCVLGCGIQPGAPKRRSVMILGPLRSGKTFLADAVAGELNAVKIDITPETFSAVVEKPTKVLSQVFLTARAFQPTVIFMKNVERVFTIKVPPEEKHLLAQSLKGSLTKLVKQISTDDKVIFIATCSNPWVARAKPMVSMFDEILLVPRTDYGTLQQFFYNKLQRISSIPRDYSVQPIAQLLQGFPMGDIIHAYNEVMSSERIIK